MEHWYYWLLVFSPAYPILVYLIAMLIIMLCDKPYNYSNDYYWENYGRRLKQAYSVKFNGENTGFNDEVAIRVRIMCQPTGDIIRKYAWAWLEQMRRFVGLKQ